LHRIKLKKLARPLTIALILSAVSFLFMPHFIDRYKGEIIEEQVFSRKHDKYFKNLYNDSTREKIKATNYPPLNNGLVRIKNRKNKSYKGIWNLEEKLITRSPLLFGDFDSNQQQEIWAFTRKKDSIFYYLLDPRKEGQYFKRRCFITTTRLLEDNKADVNIRRIGQQDLNGDGLREMYFAIDAGFSLKPRRIFAINPVNGHIYRSPTLGVRFNRPLTLYDINQDGDREILLNTHAADNYPDSSSFPYNDNSAWVIVLTKKLNFLFEPVEFNHAPSWLLTNPLKYQGQSRLFARLKTMNEQAPRKKVVAFNIKGEKLNEKTLNGPQDHFSKFMVRSFNRKKWKKTYIHSRDGKVHILNHALKHLKTVNLPLDQYHYFYFQELNSSLKHQEILIPGQQCFLLTDHDLNVLGKIQNKSHGIGKFRLSVISQSQKEILLSLSNPKKWYKIGFSLNPIYQYRWGIPAVVFIASYLLFHLVISYHKKKRNKKIMDQLRFQETERQRLAKDLHDELGSKLTGLRLQIEQNNEKADQATLNQIAGYIQNTHDEIRNIIHNLTPPRLKGNSFEDLVKNLAYEFNTNSNIQVQHEVLHVSERNGRVRAAVKTHAYRIIQEALTNIIKHSGANQAFIQVIKEKQHLEIYIEDNGHGFPENHKNRQKERSGFGLENIQLRTDLLKGAFNIETSEEGTVLQCKLPLNDSL